MQFRQDINGLRAYAVIAVVLFHFYPQSLAGGFAGVDVFFVISGYLMTGIIFKGLAQDNFSVLQFYQARAKRIIPALVVLCLMLMAFGWFYLTPFDYQALVNHSLSSMAFLSNFTYWKEAGYFDAGSHEKWLLHTWSLSAEWQFYILYPLVLVAMSKFMQLKTMKLTLLLGTIAGFIFCVFVTYKWPQPAYFLLPTRAWEMMIGGVAFLYPMTLKGNQQRLLQWLGLALIMGSYFTISEDNPWPGYLAIVPVLGTFLVIQSNRNDSVLTNNIVFQKIGAWSYSIYLWHWPIVVLFYFQFDQKLVGIALSVLLGYLSYTLVERNNQKVKWASCLLLCSIPFFGSYMIRDVDLDLAVKLENEREDYRYFYSNPECNFLPYDVKLKKQIETETIADKCIQSDRQSILLHGDSHVQHLYYGLQNQRSEAFDILQIAAFSCRFNGQNSKGCMASNKLFKQQINNINPTITVLSQRNAYELVDWDEYLQNLANLQQVVILGPSVEIDIFKLRYRGERHIINWEYMIETDRWMRQTLADKHPNVRYVSMKELLCKDSKESCIATIEGEYLHADGGHYSKIGSDWVVNELIERQVF